MPVTIFYFGQKKPEMPFPHFDTRQLNQVGALLRSSIFPDRTLIRGYDLIPR